MISSVELRPIAEPLLEFDGRKFWFAAPGMYGGFCYWLIGENDGARLAVQSWSRVAGGSGLQHDITANETILVDKAFV